MTAVDVTDAPPATGGLARALRRLYLVRFAFALVWAALVFATGAPGALGIALIVVYPLFDVAAAVVDVRASRTTGPALGLYLNIAISLLAAVGMAVGGGIAGVAGILLVWGAWAVVAGLVQLAVGIGRHRMGGQWPMILSGGISVLAGTSFALGASAPDASLSNVAGYAVLGGVFFLISALRLRHTDKES